MSDELLEIIARRPLLCDGAMGTQLMASGLPPGSCGELWNLDQPDKIGAIHRAYQEAGADLLTTNTFGANRSMLARHGLADRVAEINLAACATARAALGDAGLLLGGIGPTGDLLDPLGDTTEDQAWQIFKEQAQALCTGGVDALIVETMSDPRELRAAVAAARATGAVPVIATGAFDNGPTFRTMMGASVADAMHAARKAGADVLGCNCGSSLSLQDYVLLAREVVETAAGAPCIVQANAGTPVLQGTTVVYAATAEECADLTRDLLDAGVRIVGGCCGTTPGHLAAMRAAMTTWCRDHGAGE